METTISNQNENRIFSFRFEFLRMNDIRQMSNRVYDDQRRHSLVQYN